MKYTFLFKLLHFVSEHVGGPEPRQLLINFLLLSILIRLVLYLATFWIFYRYEKVVHDLEFLFLIFILLKELINVALFLDGTNDGVELIVACWQIKF